MNRRRFLWRTLQAAAGALIAPVAAKFSSPPKPVPDIAKVKSLMLSDLDEALHKMKIVIDEQCSQDSIFFINPESLYKYDRQPVIRERPKVARIMTD